MNEHTEKKDEKWKHKSQVYRLPRRETRRKVIRCVSVHYGLSYIALKTYLSINVRYIAKGLKLPWGCTS